MARRWYALAPCWFVAFLAAVTVASVAVAQPGGASASSGVAEQAGELTLAPANPDFLLQLLRPLSLPTSVDRALGTVPGVEDRSATMGDTAAAADVKTYSATYDLRTQGRVSPVKDQGAYGTCWSFAATGSLESCLMPGELRDYAEDNMVRQAGFSFSGGVYNGGGNIYMSTAYLVRWGGPVFESEDAYGDSYTPSGLTARKHVQDVSWIPGRSGPLDNDNIKYAVSTYGGVDVSMSWQGSSSGSSYYNASTHAYYYNGTASANHEVLVVGWDDHYSASNFATSPGAGNNGAFIVKNSWGTGWGDSGYFYVSYYDAVFGRDTNYSAVYNNAQSASNYTGVYQYDPLGDVWDVGYSGSDTGWMANVFTAASTSNIQAVGFYAEAVNTTYQVYTGTSLATLTLRTSGTCPLMGFHTIELPTAVPITSGSQFVVAVKLTTPGVTTPIALEYPSAGYSNNATASVGQSYISSDGSSWSDVTSSYANTNVCLKAYTSNGSAWQTDNDIAGSPLAASPISNSLTESSDNDDVSWIALTSGQTLQVSLTGDPGTDFDIYLFPASKTTVVSDHTGSVASSLLAGYPDTFSYTAPSAGTYYLDVCRHSGSGSYTLTYSFVLPDTTAPTTTVSNVPAGWSDADVTATFNATDHDGGSGVAYTEYNLDGAGYVQGTSVTVSATGTHTLLYRSVDNKNNTETAKSATIKIDKVAPWSSLAASPPATWVNHDVTLSLQAGDAGSGVQSVQYRLGDGSWSVYETPVVVSSEGQTRLSYRALDNAGNAGATQTCTVRIDKTGPATSALRLSTAKGKKAAFRFRLTDTTPTATVAIAIYKRGKLVKSVTVGSKACGPGQTFSWKRCTLPKGRYTWKALATDEAGNRQASAGSAVLIVR